eukprot:1490129-Rhodomonas_salina.1
MGPRKNPAASTAVSSNAMTEWTVQNVAPAIGQVVMDARNDVPVINSVPLPFKFGAGAGGTNSGFKLKLRILSTEIENTRLV